MPLALFNDALDDTPEKESAEGFTGADFAAKAAVIAADIVRAGRNLWMDVDLTMQTRPGLRFVTKLSTPEADAMQGVAYLDTPQMECLLAAASGKLFEILGDGPGAVSTDLSLTLDSTVRVSFAQLIDRMYYTDGVLGWSYFTSSWAHGTVTAFSNAAAMPEWSLICSNRFRLLAVEKNGYKIYASAVGEANVAANWVQTENVRVGSGEGDRVKALISSQSGRVIVLNLGSVWSLNTSAASAANWGADKITGLTGCVAGRTAVEIGQDVIFLSRFGVVSLGALAASDSINESNTLSSPMQPMIDRINWAAIDTAWATAWGDLYLVALPLDAETAPKVMLAFNVRTRRWMTPWEYRALSTEGEFTVCPPHWTPSSWYRTTLFDPDLETCAMHGAVIARFNEKQETILVRGNRLLKIDPAMETDEVDQVGDEYAEDNITTVDIESWATTKAFEFGSAENYKQPVWVSAEFKRSTGTEVQISLQRDGFQAYPERELEDCEIIATGLTTGNLLSFPLVFPLVFQANEVYRRSWHPRELPRFQEASIQIVCPQGRLRLRTLRMAAFIDTAPMLQ